MKSQTTADGGDEQFPLFRFRAVSMGANTTSTHYIRAENRHVARRAAQKRFSRRMYIAPPVRRQTAPEDAEVMDAAEILGGGF